LIQWGGGWLQQLGALDFAGGIVIHTSAGISALVIAISTYTPFIILFFSRLFLFFAPRLDRNNTNN
jgi:hypothetical protein